MVAEHPEDAVRICVSEQQVLHAVPTDVVMPGVSGVALVDRLRALRPGLKVLFMSGYTDRQIVDLSKFNESAAFVRKPFTPDSLGRQLRQLLDANPP